MMNIDNLWSRGTEFLGTKYSIMAGAMSWVSEHNLVSAISNAGGFGVLACGSMGPDLLRKEIRLTKEKATKPFGVNLITMHPEIMELSKVCIEEKVMKAHAMEKRVKPMHQACVKYKKFVVLNLIFKIRNLGCLRPLC